MVIRLVVKNLRGAIGEVELMMGVGPSWGSSFKTFHSTPDKSLTFRVLIGGSLLFWPLRYQMHDTGVSYDDKLLSSSSPMLCALKNSSSLHVLVLEGCPKCWKEGSN